MKSVIIDKPHSFKVVVQEIPKLEDGYDVLVKMKAAGVFRTDYHIYHGGNPNSIYPMIHGHENVGVVEAVGEKVTMVRVGDHVVIDLIITCGKFTKFLIAPESDQYIVDKKVSFSKAVLAETFTVGAHYKKRGHIVEDDIVFILGTGTMIL